MESKKKLTREDRIEELSSQILKAQEAIIVFREQYEKSKVALKESDEIQNEQISEILNKLPAGATPKGVLDDILKAATPQRTQIINNISKLSASVRIEQANHGKMQTEKGAIEKSIKDDRLDKQAEEVANLFTKFETEYLKVEDLFLKLKNLALSISVDDPGFTDRIQKVSKGYQIQVMSALFNQGGLPSLSIPFLIENISNYSDSPLADGERSVRRSEEKHIFESKRLQGSVGWQGDIPENEEE